MPTAKERPEVIMPDASFILQSSGYSPEVYASLSLPLGNILRDLEDKDYVPFSIQECVGKIHTMEQEFKSWKGSPCKGSTGLNIRSTSIFDIS